MDEATLSEEDLEKMFRAVDANGSGDVDAAEFSEWLLHDTKEDLRWRPMKRRFEDAGGAAIGKLGWVELFKRYDTDRSGELDFGEFCTVCSFSRPLKSDLCATFCADENPVDALKS